MKNRQPARHQDDQAQHFPESLEHLVIIHFVFVYVLAVFQMAQVFLLELLHLLFGSDKGLYRLHTEKAVFKSGVDVSDPLPVAHVGALHLLVGVEGVPDHKRQKSQYDEPEPRVDGEQDRKCADEFDGGDE